MLLNCRQPRAMPLTWWDRGLLGAFTGTSTTYWVGEWCGGWDWVYKEPSQWHAVAGRACRAAGCTALQHTSCPASCWPTAQPQSTASSWRKVSVALFRGVQSCSEAGSESRWESCITILCSFLKFACKMYQLSKSPRQGKWSFSVPRISLGN